MALTLTSTITAKISWNQQDTDQVQSTANDLGGVSYEENLTAGSGNEQVNTLWHDVRTLPSGGEETLDLFSLTRELFNGSFSVSFSGGNIKGLEIKNINTNVGADIRLRATGSNAFTVPWDGGSGNNAINAKSPLQLANLITGWDVTESQRYLQVVDIGGSGVQYYIGIVGVSPTG